MKRTLFTTEFDREAFNESDYRDWLDANDLTEEDKSMDDYLDYEESFWYEDGCREDLNILETELLGNRQLLLHGYNGTWMGSLEAGYIGTLKQLIDMVTDEDRIELILTDDGLQLHTANHDGSSSYDIYIISDRGLQYTQDHSYDMDRKDLHHKLMDVKGMLKKITEKDLWRS